MITSNELKGIMAMMPAFTTKDGDRPDAEDTVDTAELARARSYRQQQEDRGLLEKVVREVSTR